MTKPDRERSPIASLAAALCVVALTGCESFRLHDAGRLQLATEAATLSQEIRSSSGGAFTAMERNLNQVQDAQDEIAAILDEQRYGAFRQALGTMTREDIEDELDHTESVHDEVQHHVNANVETAVRRVDAQMRRRESLDPGRPAAPGDTDLEQTLERIDRHLTRFEGVAKNSTKALGLLQIESPESEAKLQEAIGALQSTLKIFRDATANDPTAKEALQLVLESGQEIATGEMKRLGEMKRHLTVLKGLQAQLATRDTDFRGQLLAPARRAQRRWENRRSPNSSPPGSTTRRRRATRRKRS